jgi:TonB family protein
MSESIKPERTESIKIHLAPQKWVVKLADEMRHRVSKGVSPESLARESFPESVSLTPFYGSAEQANQLRPGNELEDIRTWNQRNRKLRTEYAAMKALILKVNEAVKEKTESLRTKVALELGTLYNLILDDDLRHPAGNAIALSVEQNIDDADPDKENEFMLDESAIYDDEISPDAEEDGPSSASAPDSEFVSLIENWVADSTSLIISVFAHKAAAQAVQQNYFDGHPILFEDVEASLDEIIRTLEDAAATFNQYMRIRDSNSPAELSNGNQQAWEAPLTADNQQIRFAMDIEFIRARAGRHHAQPLISDWVEYANKKALAEIRDEFEGPKPQAVKISGRQSQICEIPVTVQGSRNTRVPQPFLEETYTAVVFPNGAVLRLVEVVIQGQIVILQNMRLKQETACRVVSFKPSAGAEANVEVEFIQPAPDFWGISFPDESLHSRSEPSAGAQHVSSASQKQQAAPEVVLPTAPISRIQQGQPLAPSVKLEIQPKKIVEITTSPAIEIPPAAPAANTNAMAATASSASSISTSSVPPAPVPTRAPEDSLALNEAIIAAYSIPAVAPTKAAPPEMVESPTEQSAPASAPMNSATAAVAAPSPIPPSVVTIPATSGKSADSGSRGDAGTIESVNARSDVRNAERPSGLSGKSAPDMNPRAIPQTIENKTFFETPLSATSAAPSKRRITFAAVGALGLLIACGVGAYLWLSSGKPVGSQPIQGSSAAILTQGTPSDSNSQSTPSVSQPSNSPARQKQTGPAAGGAGNTRKDNAIRNSANVAARRPLTLPSHIAPPVAPLTNAKNTKSENTISAPDISAQPPPAGTDSTSGVLGSIVPVNAPPAPPPASEAAPPAWVFVEPRLLSTVLPAVYPGIALARGDEGVVTLTAMVNDKGKVTGTKVISGPQTLRQAAANWVSMWRFEPARLNGKPAADALTVKVVFSKPK